MSYDVAQDVGGVQRRDNPAWARLGWLVWRECSRCGWTDAERAVSSADICDWEAGPWRPCE